MSTAALAAPRRGIVDRIRGNKWAVAAAVTFGTLMGTIDSSIINVALPHLKGTLSATTAEITWVSTGYIVASVIIMPLTAFLGARFGRKRIYMAGLVLFLIGSFFCGAARNLPVLVVFRILQGIGAGALQPTEQAILRDTFPPEEQGMAMGLYGFVIMLGPAVGPTLGGYIVDNWSWPWIFYINIPVGLIGLLMVWTFVEDPSYLVRHTGKIDWTGMGLLVVGLAALQTLLERGEENDWFQSPTNVMLAVVAGATLLFWIAHEIEVSNPSVNLRVFRDQTFASGTFMSAGLMSVLFSTIFLLPLYMQELLRYDAMQSGLALMPRSITMLIAIPIVGRFYNNLPPRGVIAFGLVVSGITCWMMSKFTLESSYYQIVLPQIFQGVGMACIFIPLTTVSLATIDKRTMSQATGVQNLVRQLGGSFGVAIFASLLTRFGNVARAGIIRNLPSSSPDVYGQVQMMTQGFMARGADLTTARARALGVLDMRVMGQSAMIGFEHAFALGAILFFCLVPMVLLLKVPPRTAGGQKAETHIEL